MNSPFTIFIFFVPFSKTFSFSPTGYSLLSLANCSSHCRSCKHRRSSTSVCSVFASIFCFLVSFMFFQVLFDVRLSSQSSPFLYVLFSDVFTRLILRSLTLIFLCISFHSIYFQTIFHLFSFTFVYCKFFLVHCLNLFLLFT